MTPTNSTINAISYVNDILIKAKNMLIEAENQAVDIREKTDILAVRKCVEGGIREILKTFYPTKQFCVKKFMAKETIKDIEHDQRMQKILDDAVKNMEE
jgi:hypothetical protein